MIPPSAPSAPPAALGFGLQDQPRRSLPALARWRLPGTWWPRPHAGLALRAWSSTTVVPFEPDEPDFRLPGGTRVHLSLEHRFGTGSVRAFLNNAFGRQLYNTTIDAAYLPRHPGRSLAVTLSRGD
jgi:hypothetical protein